MVAKAVTHLDLEKLKNEIIEVDRVSRHDDRTKAWLYYFKVDALETKTAVNDNILKTMTLNIEKLEKAVTNWFEKVNEKIDWFQDKFATKDEHKDNWLKISSLEKALDNINLKIAGVSWGFAVIIFLIDKFSK